MGLYRDPAFMDPEIPARAPAAPAAPKPRLKRQKPLVRSTHCVCGKLFDAHTPAQLNECANARS